MKKKLLSLLLMMTMFCSVFASAALAATVTGSQGTDTMLSTVKVEDVKEDGVNKLKVTITQGNTQNIKYNFAVVLVTDELRDNYADIDVYLGGGAIGNLNDLLNRDSLSNQASINELSTTGGTGSATFTIPTDFEAGSYYVVVWGDGVPMGAGVEIAVAADGSIKLDPSNAPTINTQPADAAVTVKTSHTLTIAATGDGTLTYQWQKKNGSNWQNITGATGASYQLANNNYTAALAGDYRCVVTNTADGKAPTSVESSEATISTTKINQTLTLGALTNAKYGTAGQTASATSDAADPNATGTITYSVEGPATINATTGKLEYSGVGTVTVKASITEDANYNAATATNVTFEVQKGDLTITNVQKLNVNPTTKWKDVALTGTVKDAANQTVTGSFTITNKNGEDEVGTTDVTDVEWTFTPTDTAKYNTATSDATNKGKVTVVDLTKNNVVIKYNNAEANGTTIEVTYGDTVKLEGVADKGTVTWTSGTTDVADIAADGTLTLKKAGQTVITGSSAAVEGLGAGSATVTVKVNKADLTKVEGFNTVKEAGKHLVADVQGATVKAYFGDTEVTGTLAWTGGDKEVEKNKTYEYTFTPTGDDAAKFNAFTGEFKPWKASSGNIGGGSSSSKTYTVTYDAGRRGEASRTSENVKSNAYPNKVPTVKANEGYEFKGWSLDGKTIVDPTDIRIKEDTTFTAIYESTKTADLNKDDHIAYIRGYEDGTFAPNKSITRAEAITIFARLMTEKMDVDATYSSSFSDVKAGAWYANYIGYMEDYNIINGYEDGTFRPDAAITRAEFAAMASRFDKLENTDKNVFTDVAASHWAINSINSAYAKGWIGGYPDGTFRPNQNISRAEVVSIVNNMLEREIDAASIADAQYKTFPDVAANHWAYYDVIEAANEHDYTKDGNKETWK